MHKRKAGSETLNALTFKLPLKEVTWGLLIGFQILHPLSLLLTGIAISSPDVLGRGWSKGLGHESEESPLPQLWIQQQS